MILCLTFFGRGCIFDRDLQEVIEKENKVFLAQAVESADVVKKKPVEIVLSQLENILPTAVLSDFSDEALGVYRERAGISDPLGSNEFNRRLLQQGVGITPSLIPTTIPTKCRDSGAGKRIGSGLHF